MTKRNKKVLPWQKSQFNSSKMKNVKVRRVGVNCSKFDCSTLLAGNQLLDTKFINCSNPVNPGSTGVDQMTKKVTTARQCRAVDTQFFATVNVKVQFFSYRNGQ